MNPSDLTRTTRFAVLDDGDEDARAQFGADSLREARDRGHHTIIWHFATKGTIDNVGPGGGLATIARALKKDGETAVDGVRILLSTDLSRASGIGPKTPLAAWWPGDKTLLSLDTTHRSVMLALIGASWRAQVWLAAAGIDLGDDETELDSPTRTSVEPIVISAELQQVVRQHSGLMTLPTNGIFDSHGPEFLAAVRPFIKQGGATKEAVAVAALRAGWWPEKIWALMEKL